MGSPPHTRGIPVIVASLEAIARITPAYAGNTSSSSLVTNGTEDHPRIRGEYAEMEETRNIEIGSPPHTRGILCLFLT